MTGPRRMCSCVNGCLLHPADIIHQLADAWIMAAAPQGHIIYRHLSFGSQYAVSLSSRCPDRWLFFPLTIDKHLPKVFLLTAPSCHSVASVDRRLTPFTRRQVLVCVTRTNREGNRWDNRGKLFLPTDRVN